MTSPNQPYTAPSNPEPYDTFYNPLATPIPNYDPHSIFCPEGYAEGWSQSCLALTAQKVRRAIKRTREGSPKLPYPVRISLPSTPGASPQPSTSTATEDITSSPKSTSEEVDEASAARQFDVYGCLSSLFNCVVLPSEQDEDEPPEKTSRSSSPVCENNDPSPSCSHTTTPSPYPTKNHAHLIWNNRVLQKLQSELHLSQSSISPTLLSRIHSLPKPCKPAIGPIIYTTVRNHPNHRLDWDKLQKALSYLSTIDGSLIGTEKARSAIRAVMELCWRKRKRIKIATISGAKLTRWCAAALLDQGVRVSSRFNPTLSTELGYWFFISGDRDTQAACRNLEALICSRRAVTLLRNRRSASKMPVNMPTPPVSSEESADSQEETTQGDES